MIRLFNPYFPRRTLLLAVSEAFLIMLALIAASYTRFGGDTLLTLLYEQGLFKIAVVSGVFILCMYYYDLYDSLLLSSPREVLTRWFQVLGTACVILALLYYAYPVVRLGRGIFVIGTVFVGVSLVAWRELFFLWNRSRLAQRTLVLGDGLLAGSLTAEIEKRPYLGLRLIGYVGPDLKSEDGSELRRLGGVEELTALVRRERIGRVIVTVRDGRDQLPVSALLQLRAEGVLVQDGTDVFKVSTGRVPLDALRLRWWSFSRGFYISRALLLAGPASALVALTVYQTEAVFWLALLLVTYTYFLYPLLLFFLYAVSQVQRDWRYLNARRDRRASGRAQEELPAVSLIVPAHNEQDCLPDKIANIREIDYPREKLEVVLVSDGSTDCTNKILQALQDENIRTVILPKRKGKATALNQGIAQAQSDILVMSDATTMFAPDAVQNLVRHFADRRVGVVCGSLQFQGSAESRQTEGFYWKYEGMLRLMEGRLGATLTASGAIYALRRQCFRPLIANTLIEDFIIPTTARRLGYEVLYDPEAVATEFPAASVAGEYTRRVRLAVGSFASLGELLRNPWKGLAGLAFVSHKLLRWFLPFLLIAVLLSNALLWRSPVFAIALAGQVAFYLWAAAGFLFRKRLQGVRLALVGYFLLAMNLAFLVGFIRFLVTREEATWQRVS